MTKKFTKAVAKNPNKPLQGEAAPEPVKNDDGFATREEWLVAATAALRPLFDEQGASDYPQLRLSCGWPKGGRGKTVGQAWHPDSSGDATVEIFISPALGVRAAVIETLIHELIHAIVGNEAGHRGSFKKLAVAVGLEGKMTATHAGHELTVKMYELTAPLGIYPHAELRKKTVTKQTTRMLLCECKDCGCKVRMTQKWLDDSGAPSCGCGAGKMKGPDS